MHRFFFLLLLIATTLFSLPVANHAFAQSNKKKLQDVENSGAAVSATDLRTRVKQWTQSVKEAGKRFKAEEYEASAKIIAAVQTGVQRAAEDADKKTIRMIKPVYQKLVRAHKLLTGKGQELSVLQPLPVPVVPERPGQRNPRVSFVNQVAPIIVNKCGNCHVSEERGSFSAASFTALDQSAMITYAMPDQSRLIEVIESGEMPQGNLKIEPDELKVLKAWVAEGAKFDGDDPDASLASFRPTTPVADIGAMALTGKETVSFGLHVAPVLLENCARCHIARNPRGNFNMADLAGILRGGNRGPAFKPGGSAVSEIILRMRGEGRDVMPPGGKLDDEAIQTVATWIDEGARFDRADISLPLKAVAAKGLAGSLDHEQLLDMRKEASQKLWKLAYSDLAFSETATDNFFVMGTGAETRLATIATQAESLAKRTAAVLKSPGDAPFAKGNVALFVVDKRYDFSEFGKMVEKRQFPRTVGSSWKADVAEAYVVLLAPFSATESDYELTLAKDLAAVHVSGWNPTIPRWFADGMAWWTVAKMFRRHKALATLDQNATAAAASMKQPDDFITGKLAADQAALAGYQFVSSLQSNKRSFKRLLKDLRSQKGFDASFKDAYGASPREFFGAAASGKKW